MGKEYNNENSGALFPNNDRQKDSHPHYKGSIEVTEPGEYWVSGWSNTSAKGKPYMSLKLTKKEPAKPVTEDDPFMNPVGETGRGTENMGKDDFVEDDIPF